MTDRVIKLGSRLLTLVFAFTILGVAASTLVVSSLSRAYLNQRVSASFGDTTKQITNHVASSLDNYSNILYAGRSFVLGSQEVTSSEWNDFFNSQDAFNRYPGLSSISYVEVVSKSNLSSYLAKKQSPSEFGPSYRFDPTPNSLEFALPSVVVNESSLKPTPLDYYSVSQQAIIYKTAANTGKPTTSPQIKLNSGNDGMINVLPVFKKDRLTGYITAAVRSSDFLRSLFKVESNNQISITASDITDSTQSKSIFTLNPQSQLSQDHLIKRGDQLSIGGRTWSIAYAAPQSYSQNLLLIVVPGLVLLTGLLSICILSVAFYVFIRPSRRVA